MKYKGFLLATAGGIALAPVAQAADLPIKGAPYVMPPPLPTWQGWYVGGHLGAAWQDAQNTFNSGCCGTYADISSSHTSFIGGIQVGYNWQSGTWVYGLEADISGLSGSGSASTSVFGVGGYTADNKINWLSTFRGRIGYAPNNWMFYVTGGLAVGGVKNTWTVPFSCCNKSESRTRVGWTVGGGIEYLINPNWTVAFEGLYVDLGSETVTAGFKSTKFENTAAIFRVKANYKW
jgi:outer membrane immunogenic protein